MSTVPATTPQAKQLPDSIVLGGTTYEVSATPELQNFINAASEVIATRERNKLQTTIKELKDGMAALQRAEVTATTKQTYYDFSSLKSEIIQEVTSTVKGIMQPLLKRSDISESQRIAEYRNKLVAENPDLIADLIVGDDYAQLEKALENAKAISAKAKEKYTLGATGALPTTQTTTVPAPATPAQAAPVQQAPAAPATTPTVATTTAPPAANINTPPAAMPGVPSTPAASTDLPDIKNMSMEEFAQRRKELAAKMAGL